MYNGPKNSCPHFDNALGEFYLVLDEIREVLQQRARNHESEIEAAREINSKLRDDNEELTKRVEDLEETIENLEMQIADMKEDS